MSPTEHAFVGLGANVGQPRRTLAQAVCALAALPGVRVSAVSRLYLTRPVGVADQPDFLNAAVALTVPAGPDAETGALALLAALKQLEHALGRRARQRWGPREADLDLLLFGDHTIRAQRPDGRWLEVPHREMRGRLFVLEPLADVAGSLTPPGWVETVAHAARSQRALEGEDAVVAVGTWDDSVSAWTS